MDLEIGSNKNPEDQDPSEPDRLALSGETKRTTSTTHPLCGYLLKFYIRLLIYVFNMCLKNNTPLNQTMAEREGSKENVFTVGTVFLV